MSDSLNGGWQHRVAEIGRRIPAPLILMFALILIQLSSGTAKTIMNAENALGLAFLRLVIGGVLLYAVIRPAVRGFSRTQWVDVAILGVVYAFFNITTYKALAHLPLGLVATIGFLGPIAVSLGGARRAVDFVWPVMGFAGVFLLAPISGDTELSWGSFAYGFAYAVAWGGFILASARAGKSMRGLDGFVVATVIAAVLLLPVGYSHVSYFLGTPTLIMMTVLVTVLITFPMGLEYVVLKRIEPRVFGVLLSLEPALASVVGIIMLHEMLSFSSWVAIALVTVAAIGATLGRRSQVAAE